MTDSLDTILPKIKQLLLVVLDQGATDGERINASSAVQRFLKGVESDCHDLIRQLLTKAELQKILDTGREQGRVEEIENARRNAVAIAAPAAMYDAGNIGPGVGPYTWLEIAQHFENSAHRLNDWEREFTANVVRRLRYKPPSPKEAAKLHDIFHKRFGERI